LFLPFDALRRAIKAPLAVIEFDQRSVACSLGRATLIRFEKGDCEACFLEFQLLESLRGLAIVLKFKTISFNYSENDRTKITCSYHALVAIARLSSRVLRAA
jgi:hypothetical protein